MAPLRTLLCELGNVALILVCTEGPQLKSLTLAEHLQHTSRPDGTLLPGSSWSKCKAGVQVARASSTKPRNGFATEEEKGQACRFS